MHSVSNFSNTFRSLNQIQRVKWNQGNHLNFHLKKETIKPACCSLARVICTDSRLQEPVRHEVQNVQEKGSNHETVFFPISFEKHNINPNVDHHYLKQRCIPYEIHKIEELMRTNEFKSVLARSSFFYYVNLAEHSQNCSPSSSIYYYSFEDIYCNPISYLKIKDISEKDHKVLAETGSETVKKNDTGKVTEEQLLLVIDRLTHSLLNFFEKPQDYSIYHKNIIFYNNIKGVVIKGLTAYIQAMYLLKVYGFLQYSKVKVEILKMTHHIEDGTIRVRWRVRGITRSKVFFNFLKLKNSYQGFILDETDWLDGFSVFSVGPDGLIYKHVCDKMTPDDDTVKVKKVDLKSRLLGLFELTPRTPTPGSLHTLIPCYRIQEVCNCKRLT
ncbi:uncharacterized protein C6orf136 [Trichonephila clavata]|uniref:Uncharacterized protein C6orf136 n=1 Tax=Trichonephila clavata TaxID=2740835 RepID=A0A8X6LYT6_TRICU|nr:uncharacterized protein C6orf136 [Trichonephila clavata]